MIRKIVVIGAGTIARSFLNTLRTFIPNDGGVQIILIDRDPTRTANLASLSTNYSVSQRDLFESAIFLEQENIFYRFDSETLIVCATGNWMVDLLSAETIARLYPQVNLYLFSHRFPPFIAKNLQALEERQGMKFEYSDLKEMVLQKILTLLLYPSILSHEYLSNQTIMIKVQLSKLPSASAIETLLQTPGLAILLGERRVLRNHEQLKEQFEKRGQAQLVFIGSENIWPALKVIGVQTLSPNEKILILDDNESFYPAQLVQVFLNRHLSKSFRYIGPFSKTHSLIDHHPYLQDQIRVISEENFQHFLEHQEDLLKECSVHVLMFQMMIKNIIYAETIEKVRGSMNLPYGRLLLMDQMLFNTLSNDTFNTIVRTVLAERGEAQKEPAESALRSTVFIQQSDVFEEISSKVLLRMFPQNDESFRFHSNRSLRLLMVTESNFAGISKFIERHNLTVVGIERHKVGFLTKAQIDSPEALVAGDQLIYIE